MSDYFLENLSCPSCKGRLSHCESISGGIPEPGNYTICVYCCSPLQFTSEMQLAAIFLSEVSDPHLLAMTRLCSAVRRHTLRRCNQEGLLELAGYPNIP